MSKKMLRSLLCPTELVTEEQLETDRRLLAFDRSMQHLNRRGFMAAFAGAAVAATALSGRSASAQSTTPPIVDVLNFALNFEYLESNFYALAATGTGLSTADMGTGAVAPTGAPGKLPLDAPTLAIVQALALDEKNHVELLRTAITTLGGTPISQPLINYAAMGAVTTQAQFLTAARQFTALGNSAYVGSAQLLVSNASILTTASQILGADGPHAGALNYQPGHRRTGRATQQQQLLHRPAYCCSLAVAQHLAGSRRRLCSLNPGNYGPSNWHLHGRLLPERRQRQHQDDLSA